MVNLLQQLVNYLEPTPVTTETSENNQLMINPSKKHIGRAPNYHRATTGKVSQTPAINIINTGNIGY